jgi:hypothetical protein
MRESIAIVLGVCLPASLLAMKFSSFDKMGIEAQAEFTAVMIYETQKALNSEGHADAATRIEDLFTPRPSVLSSRDTRVGRPERSAYSRL